MISSIKNRAPNLPSKCWRDSLATCPGSDPSQDFQPRCCRCACEGQTVKRCVQHLTPFWSPFVAWLHCPRDISIGADFESSVKGGKEHPWNVLSISLEPPHRLILPTTNQTINTASQSNNQSMNGRMKEWKMNPSSIHPSIKSLCLIQGWLQPTGQKPLSSSPGPLHDLRWSFKAEL